MATKEKMVLDPELWMNRTLHYQEKQSGWVIFQAIYWSIYILLIGIFLVSYTRLAFTVPIFFGVSLFVLALMIIIYGFTRSLHLKLMKRYG